MPSKDGYCFHLENTSVDKKQFSLKRWKVKAAWKQAYNQLKRCDQGQVSQPFEVLTKKKSNVIFFFAFLIELGE